MIFPISFLLVRSITKFKDHALFALGEMIGEILGILSFRDNSSDFLVAFYKSLNLVLSK